MTFYKSCVIFDIS